MFGSLVVLYVDVGYDLGCSTAAYTGALLLLCLYDRCSCTAAVLRTFRSCSDTPFCVHLGVIQRLSPNRWWLPFCGHISPSLLRRRPPIPVWFRVSDAYAHCSPAHVGRSIVLSLDPR